MGPFKDGKMHGNGTMIYADRRQYVGEWVNGQRGRQGVFTSANGDKYDGPFKDGKMHGSGTMIYVDGRKYAGAWYNGLRQGHGVFTSANGDKSTVNSRMAKCTATEL